MSTDTLEIMEPGLLTTVQDKGRYGYQRYGVPVSGAMDVFALRAANALAGNADNAACLEMTVLGPRVRFLADTWIAITGGNLSPALDGSPILGWQTVRVSRGSVLSFRGPSGGMRAYLAIAGGIDVPVVMGSRSTYIKASLGGLEGRALKAKDVLRTLEPAGEFVQRSLPGDFPQPVYGSEHEIRVVLGPQDSAFTPEGINTFLGSQYTVSMQSDRMGYRLEGDKIEHVSSADIISDGTALGAVQVPGSGQPIILLADRGTTGGYTKIATVISADIGRLAQAMPGNTITFRAVSVEDAQAVLRQQESVLQAIRESTGVVHGGKLGVIVDGEPIEIVDESGEAIALPELASNGGEGRTHRGKATIRGRTFAFEVRVHQLNDP
jgi:antagonist of KipI